MKQTNRLKKKARLAKKNRQEQAEKTKPNKPLKASANYHAAMRANLGGGSQTAKDHTTTSGSEKDNKTAAIEVKKLTKTCAEKESDSERKAREAEEERLRQIESENRRKAAEEAQQRTLEQMRQMASKYSETDTETTMVVKKMNHWQKKVWWAQRLKIHLNKNATVKSNAEPQALPTKPSSSP